jgi:hypothetical protein
MVKKRKGAQEVSDVAESIVLGETISEDDLRGRLEEIKNCEGVVGYILRNTTSASVDVKDPTKITGYAILSSFSFDVSKDFSELFDLGDVKDAIFDGRSLKILSVTVAENKISVFMEKKADLERVLMKLHTS